MTNEAVGEWRFVKVGLIVTGETEEQCLPDLFRILMSEGTCSFRVIRRVGQRSPITSERRRLKMVGEGKEIPDRDATQIGLPARRYMKSGGDYVMLVDDLESGRSSEASAVFDRYRQALDSVLPSCVSGKAAVHFLVNMLEAYYFADSNSVNSVLGTNLQDYDGDVEAIPHPKNNLKALCPSFDPKEHGPMIVGALDIGHVLSRAEACASLRTMFMWAAKATGFSATLPEGRLFQVTESQIGALGQTL